MEDALNDIEYYKEQGNTLQQAVSAAKQTVNLSTRRYQQGLVNYFEVVTNQRTELQTEQTYINVLGLQYQATISLIKALGGEW